MKLKDSLITCLIVLISNILIVQVRAAKAQETISLKGMWLFSLDTVKAGIKAAWFNDRLVAIN